MAADPYTTRASVLKRVPVGALPTQSGMAASSAAGSDRIVLDGHGFETDDPVTVRAVTESGALPSPLVEGTTYYAIRVDHSSFKLAATASGAAIDLTTNAVEMVVMRAPDFDYWIEVYSRWADTSLPGHLVPLGRDDDVPAVVESIVADLVAKRMFNVGGYESETLKDMEVASVAQLARFATGLPIRTVGATASANRAVTSSLVSTDTDPRGWGTGTLP